MISRLILNRSPYIVALAIVFTAVGACIASAQMYSDADLNAKLRRVRDGLIATVEVDIPTLVAPSDRVNLQTLKADLRLRGRRLLDLYSDGNKIVIPIETLQFFDDLAILKAWLDKHQCDTELLFQKYLHHLTKETRPKNPLAAFGLFREELLRDQFVADVSLKFYKSSVWFLIAHEIGHVAPADPAKGTG